MQEILISLKNNKNRERTKENYHKIWTRFNNFLIKLDVMPKTWEQRVEIFVAHLINDVGLQSGTIRSYVSAIKSILTTDGYLWEDNKILLSSLTKACKLQNDCVKTRFPINCGLLEILLFEVQRIFDQQPFLSLLYKAMFALGYYGLFRIGELTEGDHVAKAANVHIATNKPKILIILYSSKTHSKGAIPQRIKISAIYETERASGFVKRNFCPFDLMRRYMRARGNFKEDDEQLFILKNSEPVTPSQARTVLKLALSNVGLQSKLYNFHSLRHGRAGEMLKFGYTIEEIRRAGRWRSNAVYTYLKQW